MTAETDVVAARGDRPGRWQALHVFYSADTRPVVTECVAPLVRDLRARGLLARYFFINYWMEGSHVRLRLKPVTEAATPEVLSTAETAIREFLARRPALYGYDHEMVKFHDELFVLEYPEHERRRMYPDGRIPLQENNSVHRRAYEPEYGRYGGPAGVELAEWHFEFSSDLVITLGRTTNVHVRSVLLGLSAQLMMIGAATFLRDPRRTARFLREYFDYWNTGFGLGAERSIPRYLENYDSTKDVLAARWAEVRSAVALGEPERLSGFRGAWARHCAVLRDRVLRLGAAGELTFTPPTGAGRPAPVVEPEALLPRLLAPYLHMTNNRLGATLPDEAYLAYVLAHTIQQDPDADAARAADEPRTADGSRAAGGTR